MNVTEEIRIGRKDACNEFWDNIESITDFVVPTYVRNILKLNGFDSAATVQLIDEDDLKQIDNFGKSGGIHRILPTNTDLSDFYGPFLNSKEDFHILQGHRKVLLNISAFIRDKGYKNVTNIIATRSTNCNATYIEKRNTSLKSSENCLVTECKNSPTMNSTESTLISIASPIISACSSSTQKPLILSKKANQSTLKRKDNKISERRNCVLYESPIKESFFYESKVNDPCNSSISSNENRPIKIETRSKHFQA